MEQKQSDYPNSNLPQLFKTDWTKKKVNEKKNQNNNTFKTMPNKSNQSGKCTQ